MGLDVILKFILIGLIIFSCIFFIFGLARIDLGVDIDKVLKLYKDEVEKVKKEIDYNNKKIDEIETEIYKYKKNK